MSIQALRDCVEIIKKSKEFNRMEKAELLGLLLSEVNKRILEGEK